MSYSPFFQTLYDQQAPVGSLGRGTHYSVLRVPTWHDEFMRPLNMRANLLDFAVIWDEDHDERVIDVIQLLYLRGLLAPVRFIGERKGSLSVLLTPGVLQNWDSSAAEDYRHLVTVISENDHDDSWPATVADAQGDSHEHSIINDSPNNVWVYLMNIQVLWRLGVQP